MENVAERAVRLEARASAVGVKTMRATRSFREEAGGPGHVRRRSACQSARRATSACHSVRGSGAARARAVAASASRRWWTWAICCPSAGSGSVARAHASARRASWSSHAASAARRSAAERPGAGAPSPAPPRGRAPPRRSRDRAPWPPPPRDGRVRRRHRHPDVVRAAGPAARLVGRHSYMGRGGASGGHDRACPRRRRRAPRRRCRMGEAGHAIGARLAVRRAAPVPPVRVAQVGTTEARGAAVAASHSASGTMRSASSRPRTHSASGFADRRRAPVVSPPRAAPDERAHVERLLQDAEHVDADHPRQDSPQGRGATAPSAFSPEHDDVCPRAQPRSR